MAGKSIASRRQRAASSAEPDSSIAQYIVTSRDVNEEKLLRSRLFGRDCRLVAEVGDVFLLESL